MVFCWSAILLDSCLTWLTGWHLPGFMYRSGSSPWWAAYKGCSIPSARVCLYSAAELHLPRRTVFFNPSEMATRGEVFWNTCTWNLYKLWHCLWFTFEMRSQTISFFRHYMLIVAISSLDVVLNVIGIITNNFTIRLNKPCSAWQIPRRHKLLQ
jgi:hypothetical protein